MSHASNMLDRIIASHELAKALARFEQGCQSLVEQDFIRRVAMHAGCDYEAAEAAFDGLGRNVAGLANSPVGRAMLCVTMMTPGSALFQTTIN